MGDLTKNFSRSEYACKCGCGFDTVDYDLVMIHQQIRDHFGSSVTITSACRCDEHNARCGGADNSQHKDGRAGDIIVYGVSPEEVGMYCEEIGVPGVGIYDDFTHTDSRSNGPARWEG
jgi:uncharacterized protein YcbK (DUF882 family)